MEQLAAIFADFLARQLDLDDEERDVLRFGALTAVLHLSAVLTVIFIAIFTGTVYNALVVTAVIMIIRHASGGPHVQTPGRCFLTSTGALLALAFAGALLGSTYAELLLLHRLALVLGTSSIGLFLLKKYAPVAVPRRPLSPDHRRNMHRLSLILGTAVSTFMVLGAITGSALTVSASLGFLFQTLILTPAGCGAVNLIDGWLTAERRSFP